jgi:hypothetical protein
MGPWTGWIGGWAICVTGILVVGSLADVAARYTYLFLGFDGLAGSKVAITVFAVIIIAAMTAMCVIGTELSAHFQDILIIAQVGALLLFAVVALARVFGGTAPEGSLVPEVSWFSPFAVDNQGLLERHRGERDPRQVFASITKPGLDRLAETTPTHLAGVRRRFLERLSQAQVKQLATVWDQLLASEPEHEQEIRATGMPTRTSS